MQESVLTFEIAVEKEQSETGLFTALVICLLLMQKATVPPC